MQVLTQIRVVTSDVTPGPVAALGAPAAVARTFSAHAAETCEAPLVAPGTVSGGGEVLLAMRMNQPRSGRRLPGD